MDSPTLDAQEAPTTQIVPSQLVEQHWVRLQDDMLHAQSSTYECSPRLLEHFSIVAENKRERLQGGCTWPLFQPSLTTGDLCRNKLHVFAALITLLEGSRAGIRANDDKLGEVMNERQAQAAKYRAGQLKILDEVSGQLCKQLDRLMTKAPGNGIVRLKDILEAGPGRLAKDFRKVMHLAFGTRDAQKISSVGGHEFAFTVWLCGLYAVHETGGLERDSPLGVQLPAWLAFLRDWYGSPPVSQPSASGGEEEQDAEPEKLEVVRSCLEAIRLSLQKHPDSLYSNPSVTKELLLWCLTIVMAEGVVLPRRNASTAPDEDGYLLYLENGD